MTDALFTPDKLKLCAKMADVIRWSPEFEKMDKAERAAFLNEAVNAGSENNLTKAHRALLKKLQKDAKVELARICKLPLSDDYGEDQMCHMRMRPNSAFYAGYLICPDCSEESVHVAMEMNKDTGKYTCPLCGHEIDGDGKFFWPVDETEKGAKHHSLAYYIHAQDVLTVERYTEVGFYE
jgi:predicted RNA-binding Zn-ribbon protein involved in translation (DUF1610 family)